MDYRDEVFMAVAEKLSFSKAAQMLFISQPAVTKHIKELENKFQTNLFERKGNKIHLSPAGELCYNKLKLIRQQYQELAYELGRINDVHRGQLNIGASSTISQYVIPEVLANFHKRYPFIKLNLFNGNSDTIIRRLQQNELDIALVENNHSENNIRYAAFLDDEIIAVASPAQSIARKKRLNTNDLQHLALVLREEGSGSLEVIIEYLSKHIDIANLNIAMHLGSTEAIKNFLCEFNGIAFVSERSVKRELENKHLVQIPINNLHIVRQFRFAIRQGHEQQLSELFRNFLIQYQL
ncbi:MAG: LysR family transcriptional regulator [Mangrovibacterium sp.]